MEGPWWHLGIECSARGSSEGHLEPVWLESAVTGEVGESEGPVRVEGTGRLVGGTPG